MGLGKIYHICISLILIYNYKKTVFIVLSIVINAKNWRRKKNISWNYHWCTWINNAFLNCWYNKSEEDLKDYEDIPFISIKDPSLAIDETFYKYIMKELKYLLIHNKEDFVLRTSRNTVIYLLCKILNSLNKYESKLVNQKEIVHIYIAITSSFIGGQSENEENLLSLFFYLSEHYTEQFLKILLRDYLQIIKKEKEQDINDAYCIL